jgi:hypothetical protein
VYLQRLFTEHSHNAHANSEGTALFAYKVVQNLLILSVTDFSRICWAEVE